MPPQIILSDNEEDNIRPPTRRVSAGSKSTSDPKALELAQVEIFELRKELKKLTIETNTREIEDPKSKKSKKKIASMTGGVETITSEISKCGRKYGLMICPWIETGVFNDIVRPDMDPNSDDRYANEASKLAGTRAELYEFVPEKLHEIMEKHTYFMTNFRHQVQGSHSNTILTVRQKAGLLFGMDQEFFETSYDRGTKVEFQRLLKLPKDDSYALFAPILFPGNKYDPKLKNLFKTPLLPRIAKIMLCGKSSTTKSKPQTLAEIWQVKAATPGLIAFCAILARFLLSPEEELRQQGKVTKINWLDDFTSYKRILSGSSKKVKEIFVFFNEIAFGSESVSKMTSDNNERDNNTEEFENALRAFSVDDDEDDVSESSEAEEGSEAEQAFNHNGMVEDDEAGRSAPEPVKGRWVWTVDSETERQLEGCFSQASAMQYQEEHANSTDSTLSDPEEQADKSATTWTDLESPYGFPKSQLPDDEIAPSTGSDENTMPSKFLSRRAQSSIADEVESLSEVAHAQAKSSSPPEPPRGKSKVKRRKTVSDASNDATEATTGSGPDIAALPSKASSKTSSKTSATKRAVPNGNVASSAGTRKSTRRVGQVIVDN